MLGALAAAYPGWTLAELLSVDDADAGFWIDIATRVRAKAGDA